MDMVGLLKQEEYISTSHFGDINGFCELFDSI